MVFDTISRFASENSGEDRNISSTQQTDGEQLEAFPIKPFSATSI